MSFHAYDVYHVTGTQTKFTVSFPYIQEKHVKVYVNNNLLTEGEDYLFISPTQIELSVAAVSGDTVTIQRQTSHSDRLVDWVSGSVLSEEALDFDSLQAFYFNQEVKDMVSLNLGMRDEDGNIDVNSVKVVNVGTPTQATDAVNKDYVDTVLINEGNVTPPLVGEVGYILYADAEGSWAWGNLPSMLGTAAVCNTGTSEGEVALLGPGGAFAANRYVTMVGDSGAGGTKGAVPAPSAGDASSGKFLKASGTWEVPGTGILTGMIFIWAGANVPAGGYLWCNGQEVSRTTYAALFALIGTTFGAGNGSTTFNVPDLRGRVPLGKDNMGGVTAARVTSASTGGANAVTLGGVGGAQTHTLVTAEMPAHTHTTGIFVTDGGSSTRSALGTTGTTNQVTGSTGSGNAHSNTQPWQVLNYIIKT